jgi:predicted NUDIX family phosphoesterase
MAQVYVVDRAAFFGGDWPHGFHPIAPEAAPAFLERAFRLGRFVDRPLAEQAPAWKQWIPYCVLRCQPAQAGNEGSPAPRGPANQDRGILRVQRTKGQSEARLHGSWSIGIGGHVEPEDQARGEVDGGRFFAQALTRELREEILFGDLEIPAPRFLGLINDDSTEVGRVHAGLAYSVDFLMTLRQAQAAVRVREISKMHGGFGSLAEFFKLWQDPAQFESWSQFLIHAGVAGHMGDSGHSDRCQ